MCELHMCTYVWEPNETYSLLICRLSERFFSHGTKGAAEKFFDNNMKKSDIAKYFPKVVRDMAVLPLSQMSHDDA